LAVQQAVLILYADEARRSRSRVAGFARFPDLGCGEIGASDFAHLPGFHQSVECAECLCDRNARIRYVLLIEIDVVRSESLEARVQSLPHVFRSGAASLSLHIVPELRGDDYFPASRPQKPAEQLFTLA